MRLASRTIPERIYTVAVIIAAIAVIAVVSQAYPMSHVSTIIVLGALALLADHFAFSLPLTGSVSLAFAMSHAGLLYDGPTAAIVVSVVASISIKDVLDGKPVLHMLYNSAQLALSATAGGLAYMLLGGEPFTRGLLPGELAGLVLPALGAAFVAFVVNIVLVGVWVSLHNAMSLRDVFLKQNFSAYWVSLLVLALLGFVLANLLLTAGWAGVLLLLVPFVIARQTFLAYRELDDAYVGTIRSLVTALEAKDPYTKGHSVRVASYAGMVAHHLGLSASTVQRIEYAALLHDIGKIGMRTEMLTKPGSLTAEEYRQIQSHTAVGRDLLSGVESLADIQDAVYLHHERIDGSGYPDGLQGAEIPLEAKILAVADCFDAMTSDRPYRQALSLDVALAEIRQAAGTQLDHEVVAAFLAMDRSASGQLTEAS